MILRTIIQTDRDKPIFVDNQGFGEIDSHSLCVDNAHVLDRLMVNQPIFPLLFYRRVNWHFG